MPTNLVCRKIRRLTERIVLFFVALLVLCTWFVGGFPIFFMVQGGSMATTLLGNHLDVTCPKCQSRFFRDADDPDGLPDIVCPNCGDKFEQTTACRPLSGDCVLIDRTAFEIRRPQRWEVVAFHRWQVGPDLLVKRVVGLPDEMIEIRNGDIYANGQIQRKDLRQQRAMRILVHDDDHAGATPRWQPQEAGSNWNREHGRRTHMENTGDDIGWIVYNQTASRSGDSSNAARITDYVDYNRGRFQRNEDLHAMADVAMSFHIEDIHGRGLLWLEATNGREEFMVAINPQAGKYKVERNRQAVENAAGELPGPLRGQTIDVSLFDRRFLFAIGGRTLVRVDIDNPSAPPLADQPLAIGAEGLGLAIDRLRVYRDVYYVEPRFAAPPRAVTSWHLGADEYFVLGDNSPVSEDSRSWSQDRGVKRTRWRASRSSSSILPAKYRCGGCKSKFPI